MQTRRSFLAATSTGAIAATAGCLDFILGSGTSFEATKPSVSDSALSESGYQKNQERKQELERELEAAGQSRTVTIVNWYVEYDRTVDLTALGIGEQRAATFTAFTTPKVEIAGQTVNPIGEMSPAEILRRAQGRYDAFQDLQTVAEHTVTLVGKQTNVTRFQGKAQLAGSGREIDVELEVSEAAGSGDDYVLAVSGYPQRLADEERQHYVTLAEGVQHDG